MDRKLIILSSISCLYIHLAPHFCYPPPPALPVLPATQPFKSQASILPYNSLSLKSVAISTKHIQSCCLTRKIKQIIYKRIKVFPRCKYYDITFSPHISLTYVPTTLFSIFRNIDNVISNYEILTNSISYYIGST